VGSRSVRETPVPMVGRHEVDGPGHHERRPHNRSGYAMSANSLRPFAALAIFAAVGCSTGSALVRAPTAPTLTSSVLATTTTEAATTTVPQSTNARRQVQVAVVGEFVEIAIGEQLPKSLSTSNRSRAPKLSPTYRSHSVKHEPEQHRSCRPRWSTGWSPGTVSEAIPGSR